MAYISVGAYNATLRVPEFKGLNQTGDGISSDPRFALDCENMLTSGGVLRPMAECELLDQELPKPIETIAELHRRYHVSDEEKDVLIACSGGQLYWTFPDHKLWTKIPMPENFVEEEYADSRFSCVSYEMNPEDSESPVDVLLLSNATDGMICVRGDTLTAEAISTPKKFGIIERHAERIWGGAITDDPDMLVYSAPYDPFDWSQNNEIPEDGAGDVLQPSWDGDSFTTLKTFGSQLIAFKRNRVWRVAGTNPGEYTFYEQFGGGTNYARTVAVDVDRILMLGNESLLQYDGESVYAFQQNFAKDLFRRLNRNAIRNACACIWKSNYYCAIPVDGSETNNAVLVYNAYDNTFLVRTNVFVESFLPTENALYFTSASTPGRLWRWKEDSWDEAEKAVKAVWSSNWFDLGVKNVTKGSFTLYLTVECREPVELKVLIQTEKKTKGKTLVFYPAEEGKEAKQRRMVFGGNGRRFRFMIESEGHVPWRLIGGLQLEAETDTD